MVNFLNNWVKNLSLSIIVVSLLEMLLPNNRTKKYIKMVMGIYILFSIIYPFAEKSLAVSVDNLNIEEFDTTSQKEKSENIGQVLDQSSMDKRLNEIYVDELEKDIKNKLEKKGFVVNTCKVNATIIDNQNDSGIHKMVLKVKKGDVKEMSTDEKLEKDLVSEVKKIQKVQIGNEEKTNNDEESSKDENYNTVTKTDIKIIKNFLTEEYGVSEECLEIN